MGGSTAGYMLGHEELVLRHAELVRIMPLPCNRARLCQAIAPDHAMPGQAMPCQAGFDTAMPRARPVFRPLATDLLPLAPHAPQSCALLGIFSYFVDGMSGGEAQAAALRSTPAAAGAASSPAGTDGAPARSSGSRQQHEEQLRQWQQQRKAVEQLLSPVMPLLAAAAPCVFAWEEGSGSPAGGCRVVRRR